MDGVLMRYEPDGCVTVLASWNRSGQPSKVGARIELGGESATARVLATGRTARMDGYSGASGAMAEYVRRVSGADAVSIAAPIVVDGRIWGVLLAGWRGAEWARADAAETGWRGAKTAPADVEQNLSRFTELVGMAIANAQSRSELAASRKRLVIAGDEARHRIQRNLHDGAQQRLVSLGFELRGLKEAVGAHDPLSARLERMQAILDEASSELQDISRGLHPALLSRGGLRTALSALVERSAIGARLSVDLPERLPEPLEVAVYYIVSEALTNAAKHAQASTVHVDLSIGEGELLLDVRDDGVGGADPAGGSGLTGLCDRIEAIGGILEIESPQGAGTRLRARLPIPATQAGSDDAAER
jgi:signal transduction histidine kinase